MRWQPYAGISNIFGPEKSNTTSMQTGVSLCPFKKFQVLYLSLENNFSYAPKRYTWPEEGTYHYRRTYNQGSLSVALRMFYQRRLNIMLGMRAYIYYQKGKLITDNERLKSYLSEGYYSYCFSICPYLHFNYRINNRTSVYLNCYMHRVPLATNENLDNFLSSDDRYLTQNVIGIGVGYNIYAK